LMGFFNKLLGAYLEMNFLIFIKVFKDLDGLVGAHPIKSMPLSIISGDTELKIKGIHDTEAIVCRHAG
ncbi:MAG: hypothetical protein Q8R64_04510, partial [Sulfurimicrobium sp.]|nr:hypothetical protein [Sulfurimicrobium sp.]